VTRDTPFNLIYGAEAVLPSEIYLEPARVAHFNAEDQVEPRELDSDLLEESVTQHWQMCGNIKPPWSGTKTKVWCQESSTSGT
jgi:hypothetical protein